MIDEKFELLQQKADIQARIKLLPYSGTPEVKKIKDKSYLYMRKRVAGKLTSSYVGEYSDELYQLLLRSSREEKDLNKQLRQVEKDLLNAGYSSSGLDIRVMQNLDFARANMKTNIYDQAILEGVATSFPQTEDIIERGFVSGMASNDVQKILNLKHAWEFILDRDVILCNTDYGLLCQIARIVNEGFFFDGGRIRGVPVTIGGSSYVPPLPIEIDVIESINSITRSENEAIDIAIELCLYCMKTQIFIDGNKRAAVIFANHFLISKGQGFLVIPSGNVSEFKKMLVNYYEGKDALQIKTFMKEICHKNF